MKEKDERNIPVLKEEIYILCKTDKKSNTKNFMLERLNSSFRNIERVYEDFNRNLVDSKSLPKGADWLLDNFYLIELTYKQLKQDVEREKRIELNVVKDGLYKGYPRIYILALDMIHNSTGNISEDKIIKYINNFQKDEILSLEEISFLPKYLTLGLIEYIESIVTNMKYIKEIWDEVDSIDFSSKENLEKVIENIDLADSIRIERIIRRIREGNKDFQEIFSLIDEKLRFLDKSIEEILEREYTLQSKNKVSLGYGITSLRNSSSLNWENIFDSIRAIDKVLREDPLGIYEKMDSESKEYYRYHIKVLAEKFKVQEISLSKKILEFAREQWDRGIRDKRAHVGYYLIDKGREKLFKYYRDNGKTTIYLGRLRYYLVPILGITFLLTILLSNLYYDKGNLLLSTVIFIVGFIPILSIVLNFVNYFYSKRFKPKLIPKLDFKYEIPEELSTLVVVPTLITDKDRIVQLAKSLEVHYLSNRQKNIYYALLGDFKDIDEKNSPDDESIIEKGIELFSELNRKYAKDEDIFFYFHRERVYSETQGKWMGWERKRGALIELNRLLLGDNNTSFKAIYGDVSKIIGKIKYVITLDADTKLPIDVAKKLIGAISHPLNWAVIDEQKNIVVDGYGIIQPRILIDIESSTKSLFTKIFAGQGGMDPYSTAVSDIYQDLFGEGIFTGKGIYDLRVFQRCLDKTIPENAVLSHDLLEGCYIRVGLATDIQLVDGYPEKYSSYIKRQHRWVRGDWQLIRWLAGPLGKNLSSLSKWKMLDNMRRSLLPISLLIVLILGLAFLPGNIFVWFGLAVLNLFYPIITKGFDDLIGRRFNFERIKFNDPIIPEYKRIIYQGFVELAFLPNVAYMMLDAIIRTLYRVYVSKKNLLEWTTAFDTERKLKNDVLSYFNLMKANAVMAAVVFYLTYAFNIENLFVATLLSLLWLFGPVIAYRISKEDEYVLELKEEDRELLVNIAEKTWKYYKEFTDSKNNYLPPDNFQEYPYNGVANRTSPTNIGFYLLSVLCSRDLNFIDTSEMITRIKQTLDTIEKMEKWEGHLYNWYDTTNLEPLKPIFVSTVDSGNFVSYLIVLKEGLKEYIQDANDEEAYEIELLIERIEKLINNTNFSPLYDEARNLFYIGYNVEEEKALSNYYDLLASEARISSYIAISRGEVPVKHWKMLGKPLVTEDNYIGLASWSGTMFEYLMPSLVLKSFKNTLINETYKTVIRIQKAYGRKNNVPWGISESGFFAFDNQLNYQYKAFGVPVLGFKRGLKDELVVSPYATFLALKFDCKGVLENINRLRKEGMEGPYGFYEAVDYTLKRLPSHLDKGIVKSYMSHHQGMILAAINNFLNGDILVRRFHRDPQMKCGELLLQESIPLNPIISKEKDTTQEGEVIRRKEESWEKKVYTKESLKDIKCHLLSSGPYTLMITNRGEGFSKNGNIFINRWRRDYLLSPYGQFIYIKDIKNKNYWSTTYAPVYKEPDDYNVEFSIYKASFTRKDGFVETKMDIFLLPEESGEIRRVRLINNGEEEALLETISYLEIVGDDINSDIAHQTFNNLFVRTEAVEEMEGLLAYRRKRQENQQDLWMLHLVKAFDSDEGFQYETSRLDFIGRCNGLKNPKAIEKGLTNTTGTVLDPIFSIGKKVRIPPKGKADIYYITALANSKEEAIRLMDKYNDMSNIKLAIDLFKTKSQTEVGYLTLNRSKIEPFDEMLPYLLFIKDNIKGGYRSLIAQNERGKEGLWAKGISGDYPIILVTINTMKGLENLMRILNAHEYWSYKGLTVDLVIMNKDESIYYQPLYESIREEVYERRKNVLNRPGGIFIINENTLTVEDKSLLYNFANIIIDAEKGMTIKPNNYSDIPYKEFNKSKIDYPKKEYDLNLDYFNEYGGFAENGKKYVIKLSDGVNTPMPWINVIANRNFGCIITESGAGFTWADNSRENKLTPWYNDPVLSHQGEILYLMDNETGEVWSITPKPIRDENDYIISHSMGYTTFYHNSNGIEQELTVFVPIEDKVKVNLVKLKNESDVERDISLYYYIRPVLGVTDEETEKLLETDIADDIVIVRNPANTEFKGSTLFIGTSEDIRSYTGDRNEFLGSIPNYEMPEGMKRVRLSNTLGIGYNPCVVLEVNIRLQPNEQKEIVFLLAEDKDRESGCKLIGRYKDIQFAKEALESTKQFWESLVSTIQVDTPDEAMNYMMNQWLIYQTVVSRIWARAGFYQVGGAYGARDQMQDATNMIYHLPEITKDQILNNCAHQFKEGDIQHWWHPTPNSQVHKGIRSRYSDDLLWLPLGVAKYIKVTGDVNILKEEVPFIESPTLKETEMERYEMPTILDEIASVYEHCIRAIERALKFGDKGLPLMGGGDWNDGMNKVGYQGKGQSVWLGWFLATVLKEFIQVCELMEDYERANRYRQIISQLKEALEKNAWDGEWYIRAFFDDGTPLGSKENSECMIDSIAQSWSVISGIASAQRSKMALESLEKYLINEEEGIIALLTPPFSDSDLDPGYIKSYVPGVRENGGQYTHAAIWAVKAFAMLGEGDRAYNLFRLINPINHSRTSIESAKYKVEPYVVTADVYTNPQHLGRGGWTWYTGSSGWMYIVGLEDILGFKIEKNKLIIDPCIPKNWGEFSIRYRHKSTNYNIKVVNPSKVNKGVRKVYLDYSPVEDKCIELIDDGKEHIVLVEMG